VSGSRRPLLSGHVKIVVEAPARPDGDGRVYGTYAGGRSAHRHDRGYVDVEPVGRFVARTGQCSHDRATVENLAEETAMNDRTDDPNDHSNIAHVVDAHLGFADAPMEFSQDHRAELIARLVQRAQWMTTALRADMKATSVGQMIELAQGAPARLVADYMAAPWGDLVGLPGVVVFAPPDDGIGEAEHVVLGRVRRGRRWTAVLGDTGTVTLLRSDLRLPAGPGDARPQPSDEEVSSVAMRAPEPDVAVRSMLALAIAFEESCSEFGRIFGIGAAGQDVDPSLKDCPWSADESKRDGVAHVRVRLTPGEFGRTKHLLGKARCAAGWTAVETEGRVYLLRDANRVGPVVPLEDDERAELLRLRAQTHGGTYGIMLAHAYFAGPMAVRINVDKHPRACVEDVPGRGTVLGDPERTVEDAIESLRLALSTEAQPAIFVPPSTRRPL